VIIRRIRDGGICLSRAAEDVERLMPWTDGAAALIEVRAALHRAERKSARERSAVRRGVCVHSGGDLFLRAGEWWRRDVMASAELRGVRFRANLVLYVGREGVMNGCKGEGVV